MSARRQWIVAIVLILFLATRLQSQGAAAGATDILHDSAALAATGARDGILAAENVPVRGSFFGGLASGLLGPLGLLFVVPHANRAVEPELIPRGAVADTSRIYVNSFFDEFAKTVRSRRRKAAITGNLILTIPLLIAQSGPHGGF
jgi:hypothetical protein